MEGMFIGKNQLVWCVSEYKVDDAIYGDISKTMYFDF